MNLNYIRAAVEPPYYRATIEPGTTVSLLAFQVQQNLMFTYFSVGRLILTLNRIHIQTFAVRILKVPRTKTCH